MHTKAHYKYDFQSILTDLRKYKQTTHNQELFLDVKPVTQVAHKTIDRTMRTRKEIQ